MTVIMQINKKNRVESISHGYIYKFYYTSRFLGVFLDEERCLLLNSIQLFITERLSKLIFCI